MLFLFVFFVFFNMAMIRSEDKIVNIDIKKNKDGQKTCIVNKEVELVGQSNFTLKITSEYFIKAGFWYKYGKNVQKPDPIQIKELNFSKTTIIYLWTIGSDRKNETKEILYTSSHDQNSTDQPGKWTFTFEVIADYDPWSFKELDDSNIVNWTCSTEVKIDGASNNNPSKREGRSGPSEDPNLPGKGPTNDDQLWLIILLSVIGALLFAQSTYIIWGKVRDHKLNTNSDKDPIAPKSPNAKRGSDAERNIADRPPLPLPPDEVMIEPVPPLPLSPVSPGLKRHLHHPTAPPMPMIQALNSYHCQPGPIPPNSYRNKGLDTSEEGVTSPASARRHMEANLTYEEIRSPELSRRYMGGPLVQKQSYRNKALENSDEELRGPGYGPRHEGPLVPKPLYKNNALEKSVEELRSPDLPRRHEGPLVPKPSYKNNILGNSEELRNHDFAGRQPGPLLPKKSIRNKELHNSVEQLRSPELSRRHEGPLVPKQSFNRKPLVDSDEEMGTPHFARRQMEAKLAQLPPKGIMPSPSFKQPRPLPRRTSSPPPPPEKPAFHPAHRLGDAQTNELEEALRRRNNGDAHSNELEEALRRRNNDPGPPLLPKKAVLFATPEACRAQDSRRFSDEEWQYEKLQPDSKYLSKLPNNTHYL